MEITPYTFAKEWVKKRFISFTIEDIKQAFVMAGGKLPKDGSVWGNVLMALKKSKAIYKHPVNEVTTVKRPNGKTKYINVWISREYRLKQHENATKEVKPLKLFT